MHVGDITAACTGVPSRLPTFVPEKNATEEDGTSEKI
jgi:hypothetical protein